MRPVEVGSDISIHAPLTGSDCPSCGQARQLDNFNPRSPYGERQGEEMFIRLSYLFQSTLPLRGATLYYTHLMRICQISIHAPLTGSDETGVWEDRCVFISIHAPLTGSDAIWQRHPGGPYISIHAPLTGSDNVGRNLKKQPQYFNPRSPYGERHTGLPLSRYVPIFQSTLPLRGATFWARGHADEVKISIHAPLTGSDSIFPGSCVYRYDFNPRSPYGERPVHVVDDSGVLGISIHAPLTGSDTNKKRRIQKWQISIHAPLTGSDISVCFLPCRQRISIHAPLTGSDKVLFL